MFDYILGARECKRLFKDFLPTLATIPPLRTPYAVYLPSDPLIPIVT
jgi:hypothetical protein